MRKTLKFSALLMLMVFMLTGYSAKAQTQIELGVPFTTPAVDFGGTVEDYPFTADFTGTLLVKTDSWTQMYSPWDGGVCYFLYAGQNESDPMIVTEAIGEDDQSGWWYKFNVTSGTTYYLHWDDSVTFTFLNADDSGSGDGGDGGEDQPGTGNILPVPTTDFTLSATYYTYTPSESGVLTIIYNQNPFDNCLYANWVDNHGDDKVALAAPVTDDGTYWTYTWNVTGGNTYYLDSSYPANAVVSTSFVAGEGGDEPGEGGGDEPGEGDDSEWTNLDFTTYTITSVGGTMLKFTAPANGTLSVSQFGSFDSHLYDHMPVYSDDFGWNLNTPIPVEMGTEPPTDITLEYGLNEGQTVYFLAKQNAYDGITSVAFSWEALGEITNNIPLNETISIPANTLYTYTAESDGILSINTEGFDGQATRPNNQSFLFNTAAHQVGDFVPALDVDDSSVLNGYVVRFSVTEGTTYYYYYDQTKNIYATFSNELIVPALVDVYPPLNVAIDLEAQESTLNVRFAPQDVTVGGVSFVYPNKEGTETTIELKGIEEVEEVNAAAYSFEGGEWHIVYPQHMTSTGFRQSTGNGENSVAGLIDKNKNEIKYILTNVTYNGVPVNQNDYAIEGATVEDGTVTIVYNFGDPVKLTDQIIPNPFLQFWPAGSENAKATFTFDGTIKGVGNNGSVDVNITQGNLSPGVTPGENAASVSIPSGNIAIEHNDDGTSSLIVNFAGVDMRNLPAGSTSTIMIQQLAGENGIAAEMGYGAQGGFFPVTVQAATIEGTIVTSFVPGYGEELEIAEDHTASFIALFSNPVKIVTAYCPFGPVTRYDATYVADDADEDGYSISWTITMPAVYIEAMAMEDGLNIGCNFQAVDADGNYAYYGIANLDNVVAAEFAPVSDIAPGVDFEVIVPGESLGALSTFNVATIDGYDTIEANNYVSDYVNLFTQIEITGPNDFVAHASDYAAGIVTFDPAIEESGNYTFKFPYNAFTIGTSAAEGTESGITYPSVAKEVTYSVTIEEANFMLPALMLDPCEDGGEVDLEHSVMTFAITWNYTTVEAVESPITATITNKTTDDSKEIVGVLVPLSNEGEEGVENPTEIPSALLSFPISSFVQDPTTYGWINGEYVVSLPANVVKNGDGDINPAQTFTFFVNSEAGDVEYMEASLEMVDPLDGQMVASLPSVGVTWEKDNIKQNIKLGGSKVSLYHSDVIGYPESNDLSEFGTLITSDVELALYEISEEEGGEPGIMTLAEDDETGNALRMYIPDNYWSVPGTYVLEIPAGVVVDEAGRLNQATYAPVFVLPLYPADAIDIQPGGITNGEVEVSELKEIVITFEGAVGLDVNNFDGEIRINDQIVDTDDLDFSTLDPEAETVYVKINVENYVDGDGSYTFTVPEGYFSVYDEQVNFYLSPDIEITYVLEEAAGYTATFEIEAVEGFDMSDLTIINTNGDMDVAEGIVDGKLVVNYTPFEGFQFFVPDTYEVTISPTNYDLDDENDYRIEIGEIIPGFNGQSIYLMAGADGATFNVIISEAGAVLPEPTYSAKFNVTAPEEALVTITNSITDIEEYSGYIENGEETFELSYSIDETAEYPFAGFMFSTTDAYEIEISAVDGQDIEGLYLIPEGSNVGGVYIASIDLAAMPEGVVPEFNVVITKNPNASYTATFEIEAAEGFDMSQLIVMDGENDGEDIAENIVNDVLKVTYKSNEAGYAWAVPAPYEVTIVAPYDLEEDVDYIITPSEELNGYNMMTVYLRPGANGATFKAIISEGEVLPEPIYYAAFNVDAPLGATLTVINLNTELEESYNLDDVYYFTLPISIPEGEDMAGYQFSISDKYDIEIEAVNADEIEGHYFIGEVSNLGGYNSLNVDLGEMPEDVIPEFNIVITRTAPYSATLAFELPEGFNKESLEVIDMNDNGINLAPYINNDDELTVEYTSSPASYQISVPNTYEVLITPPMNLEEYMDYYMSVGSVEGEYYTIYLYLFPGADESIFKVTVSEAGTVLPEPVYSATFNVEAPAEAELTITNLTTEVTEFSGKLENDTEVFNFSYELRDEDMVGYMFSVSDSYDIAIEAVNADEIAGKYFIGEKSTLGGYTSINVDLGEMPEGVVPEFNVVITRLTEYNATFAIDATPSFNLEDLQVIELASGDDIASQVADGELAVSYTSNEAGYMWAVPNNFEVTITAPTDLVEDVDYLITPSEEIENYNTMTVYLRPGADGATFNVVISEAGVVLPEPVYSATFNVEAPADAYVLITNLSNELPVYEGTIEGGKQDFNVTYELRGEDMVGYMFSVSEIYDIEASLADGQDLPEGSYFIPAESSNAGGYNSVSVDLGAMPEGVTPVFNIVVKRANPEMEYDLTLEFAAPVYVDLTSTVTTPVAPAEPIAVSLVNSGDELIYTGLQYDVTLPSFMSLTANDVTLAIEENGVLQEAGQIAVAPQAAANTYRVLAALKPGETTNQEGVIMYLNPTSVWNDELEAGSNYVISIDNVLFSSELANLDIPANGYKGNVVLTIEDASGVTDFEITSATLMSPSFIENNEWINDVTEGERLALEVAIQTEDGDGSNLTLGYNATDGIKVEKVDGVYVVSTADLGLAADQSIDANVEFNINGISKSYDFTVRGIILGDSNDNGAVTVSDVVTTANYVAYYAGDVAAEGLGDLIARFDFPNGDVVAGSEYEPSEINAQDIVETVNIALGFNKANAKRYVKRVDTADALVADNFKVVDGKANIGVRLDNINKYAAIQAEVKVPAGMTVTNVTAGPRAAHHNVIYNVLANGNVKVVIYSIDNTVFTGNDGALFNIEVAAAEDCGNVRIGKIRAADTDANGYDLGYSGGTNIGVTGLDGIDAEENEVRYFTIDGIEIQNPERGAIVIRMENGKAEKVVVK